MIVYSFVLMVLVNHPSMWPFCGYNEIQKPRKKNVLINYEKLRKLVGIEYYDSMRVHYKGWIEDYMESQETGRDDKWTSSIAACPVKSGIFI